MNANRIRGFLLQQPKPVVVRVSTADGEPQELKPGKSFARCAESIEALHVDLIECIDKDGNLIRAIRTDSPEAQRSEAAEIPAGISSDPHALMLTHFSNLIHRAYAHSTEVAFSRMVELVERMGDRSDAIERRLERAEAAHRRVVEQQIDDAFDHAEQIAAQASATGAGVDFVSQMAQAYLSGVAQPKPNGKA